MKPWKVTGKTGKVSWQIFYRTPEGKGVGKRFKTKMEAEAYLAKVTVAKRENRYQEVFDVKKETRTTFNELADKYVENFKTQKAFNRCKAHVIRDLRQRFGDKKLSEITYYELESYRNQRKAILTPAGTPRAPASVNADLSTLQHMLGKAVEWELLETSPFEKGKKLPFKVNNQRTRFLSEPEIEALLKECSRHLKPIVETAILTGMRRGELLSLKWDQIRNDNIYLEAAMTKSNKGRQIPINDRLAEVLRELRQTNQLKSPYVFCDAQGRRFGEVRHSFKGACRRAGIEDFRFHDLRHTFASRMVSRGASIKAVQELLGHADLTMTMRYSHLSKDVLRDAVALLNDTPGAKEKLNYHLKGKKAAGNFL